MKRKGLFKELGENAGLKFGAVMAEAIRECSGPGEELLSTCCGIPKIDDSDLCGLCHDHASFCCEACPDSASECECVSLEAK